MNTIGLFFSLSFRSPSSLSSSIVATSSISVAAEVTKVYVPIIAKRHNSSVK